jgi:molybdate transport system substrate-binding protein
MRPSISVLSSMATKTMLTQACEQFASEQDCLVALESIGGVDAAKRIRAGTVVDVVVIASQAIDQLINEQHLSQSVGRCDWVCSGISVAVATNTRAPSLKNSDEVKTALSQARRVCYSTGPSGVYLENLFIHWGISEQIRAKCLLAPAGVPVGSLVALGEADIGFQQLSELIGMPGIQVAGPLPPEIQLVTTFSAGVHQKSQHVDLAQRLLAHLRHHQLHPLIRQHGMEPA